MQNFDYDDSQLQHLFAEMDVKQRMRTMRGAFRREANNVRKTAINNLRSSLNSNRDLEKGIRAIVFKQKAGFRVTVGTKRANKQGKGERGFHVNRFGQKKPVLIWAEDGTNDRFTKNGTKWGKRQRSSHWTGRMRRYAFMETTQDQVEGQVTEDLHKEVSDNIIKQAKKYGCK